MYEAAKKSWIVFILAAGCFLVGGTNAPRASADAKTVIRFATIAPGGSTFGKILRAWGRSLSKETQGRVELRYYSGGSQGDERDFIRKMRAGQMDAAGV
ncbi:MAG: TRAP transporter substrate-binding protein DctP, partial [Polyangiales bacterium]